VNENEKFNLEMACEAGIAAARRAGKRILPYFRTNPEIQDKGGRGFDPVTEADRVAETVIRESLTAAFPDHGFVGEEHGAQRGDSEYTWHVDPIDGTRSFVMGQLHWGTLIALSHDGTPVLGLMHQPYTQETFFAARGQGAWLEARERKQLHSRPCAALDSSLAAATSEDMFSPDELRGVRRAFDQARLARWGGDCYNYCLLAAGHIDLVIEASLSAYDILALVPLIEEAGGVITTWEGKPVTDGGRVVAAGDRRVHETVLEMLAGVNAG
jgi:myo-inositol-1(or 4)-monophosphatase